MRTLLIAVGFACFACGSDEQKKTDASVDDSGGGGSDAMPDTPAGGLSCATYCSKVMSACTTTRAQYSSMANCLDTCANFPMGTAADQQGNTLGCRINHADLAASDPMGHCVHAGPAGGGTCGTLCAGFCSIVVAECPSQWTMQTCTSNQTGCPSFNSVPPYAAGATGDSAECRLYHATMAATDPGGHCSHTTEASSQCQ